MRQIFDQMAGPDGVVDRTELNAKLKADSEIEELLGHKDTNGVGLSGARAMGRVMVLFDTDKGDMGSGMGKITWPEFEAAFKKAQKEEEEDQQVPGGLGHACGLCLCHGSGPHRNAGTHLPTCDMAGVRITYGRYLFDRLSRQTVSVSRGTRIIIQMGLCCVAWGV